MPITFDTLTELKAFYRDFRLVEQLRRGTLTVTEGGEVLPRRAPGRPPKSPMVEMPKKRGRKPKLASEKAPLKRGPRAEKGETLTAKIQASIQSFLDTNRSFTANDVYDDLSQKDGSVNKQSVITSVLKQMNTTFQHIAVTERAGNGPRPVKLYNP